jgi:exonuclease III
MTFNSDITSTWRAADEILFQTSNEGNFKVATWNCNQMTETKAEYIAWYVVSMGIDVLFIQDTRLTPAMYKAVSYRLKVLLGAETFIASSIKAHTNYTVGGQIVIVNSNLKQKIDGLWSDTTGLGLAMAITIDTTGSKLQIMSTYWPAKPTGEESSGLHNATLEALKKMLTAGNH